MGWKIATFILGIMLCAGGSATAQDRPRFTVLVYNDAGVSTAVIEEAEGVAREIFQQAGLAVLWKNPDYVSVSDGWSSGDRGDTTFSLRIVQHLFRFRADLFGLP